MKLKLLIFDFTDPKPVGSPIDSFLNKISDSIFNLGPANSAVVKSICTSDTADEEVEEINTKAEQLYTWGENINASIQVTFRAFLPTVFGVAYTAAQTPLLASTGLNVSFLHHIQQNYHFLEQYDESNPTPPPPPHLLILTPLSQFYGCLIALGVTFFHEMIHLAQAQFNNHPAPSKNSSLHLIQVQSDVGHKGSLAEEYLWGGEIGLVFSEGFEGNWSHLRALIIFRESGQYLIDPSAYPTIFKQFPNLTQDYIRSVSQTLYTHLPGCSPARTLRQSAMIAGQGESGSYVAPDIGCIRE